MFCPALSCWMVATDSQQSGPHHFNHRKCPKYHFCELIHKNDIIFVNQFTFFILFL